MASLGMRCRGHTLFSNGNLEDAVKLWQATQPLIGEQVRVLRS